MLLYKSFGVHILTFLMVYLSVEILVHRTYIYLTLVDKACFPNQLFIAPLAVLESSHGFTPSLTLGSVSFYNYSHSVVCSHGFIFHLPDD